MKLIVGLGNPGAEYEKTRHNTGFMLLDRLADKWDVSFADKPKFHGDIAQADIDGTKTLLLKSNTYYNETGRSVRALMDFYKLELTDVLVIHDDLALPFGTVRSRVGGSDAGNNGIKSITSHIGHEYARIRVGTWSELREKTDAVDFVLTKFSTTEQQQLQEIVLIVEKLARGFAAGSFKAVTELIETIEN